MPFTRLLDLKSFTLSVACKRCSCFQYCAIFMHMLTYCSSRLSYKSSVQASRPSCKSAIGKQCALCSSFLGQAPTNCWCLRIYFTNEENRFAKDTEKFRRIKPLCEKTCIGEVYKHVVKQRYCHWHYEYRTWY